MSIGEILGYIAAALTTLSFVPQVVKILKEKSARDISLITFIMFTAGVVLWVIYGAIVMSWPVMIANSVTLLFSSAILYFKFKY